jgi:hypothetical protein
VLDCDSEKRLFLFFRIVKGWSLGMRLTGKDVTAHDDGTLSGFAQSYENDSTPQIGGDA